MQVFLDAITKYYLVFLIITIFLILSLIGYIVHKKTNKDADIAPLFSSVGKKEKLPKVKKPKGKKGEVVRTVVGGDAPAQPGINTAVAQTAPQAQAPVAPPSPVPSQPMPSTPNTMQGQAISQQPVMPNAVSSTPQQANQAQLNPVQAQPQQQNSGFLNMNSVDKL